MTQARDLFGVNLCFTSGLLTATGSETLYDTTVIVTFTIDGELFEAAAITNGVTPLVNGDGVTLTALAANEGCCLVWTFDNADAVSLYQGDVTAHDDNDGFLHAPSMPSVPDTETAFAYQILVNDSTGSAVTIGTTNWDATGFTNTITNVSTLPLRPKEA